MRRTGRSVIAILLTVMISVTFMPMFDGTALAANPGGGQEASGDYDITQEVVKLSEDEFKANKEEAIAKVKEECGVIDEDEITIGAPAFDAQEAEPGEEAEDGQAASLEEKAALAETAKEAPAFMETDLKQLPAPESGTFKAQSEGEDTIIGQEDGIVSVSDPDVNNWVTIVGSDLSATEYKDYRYQAVYVGDDVGDLDSAELVVGLNDAQRLSFTTTIDMKNFSVGFHTIYVVVASDEDAGYFTLPYVPTFIYQKLPNRLSNYYTGIHYFTCSYSDSNYYEVGPGEYLDVYMDYKGGSQKNWSDEVYLVEDSYTNYKKAGLKANTAYRVRLMLGKRFTYNGEDFLFTGRQTGFASDSQKILTAYNKPKVKSIKASRVKTIVHKYKVHYANRYYYRVNRRTGYRRLIKVVPLYHTYRYYYTRYRITVKFKKKQKVAGICIRTIQGLYAWKLGDKTKYAQTFKVSGKKKGKRVAVNVQSFRSKVYGGYSKKYRKKVKL